MEPATRKFQKRRVATQVRGLADSYSRGVDPGDGRLQSLRNVHFRVFRSKKEQRHDGQMPHTLLDQPLHSGSDIRLLQLKESRLNRRRGKIAGKSLNETSELRHPSLAARAMAHEQQAGLVNAACHFVPRAMSLWSCAA